MAKISKIPKNPEKRLYYIVDTNFFVNKYLPHTKASEVEKQRIIRCKDWWKQIDSQISKKKAKVFIPDICIAESFKVLAERYYSKKATLFKDYNEYSKVRKILSDDITVSSRDLRKPNRYIKYHDISTNRDLIISVDRFFEAFYKNDKKIQIPDLIVLATAKYLIDFYDLDLNNVFILSLDKKLIAIAKSLGDLPYAIEPTNKYYSVENTFE